MTHSGPDGQRGQVLPLFALFVTALLAMCALVFDGAQVVVLRRQLQDAGDAAALAAANVVQVGSPRGCSAVTSPNPGAPRAAVTNAAKASVASNLPGYPLTDVVVSCPAGWENAAVRVELGRTSASFFGGIVGQTDLSARTTSAAVNGQITGLDYSVVQLDPGNPTWPQGRRGCPSVLFSGGPTVVLDSSMQINSACRAEEGGALATNGNATSLTMVNESRIRVVGGYAPAALTISPAPLTGQPAMPDPFAFLPPIPVAELPVRSTSKLTILAPLTTLQPGIYRGGIELKSTSIVLLEPGIYVMDGGGLAVGAQAMLMSIPKGTLAVTPTTWQSDCPPSSCGVLIYNTGTTSTLAPVNIGAGATVKLRAYAPAADPNPGSYQDYDKMLIWQSGSPAPTSTYSQPPVELKGGGGVDIAGTVYAPGALVRMGGSSGGSGGESIVATLQFVSWDLELYGNSSFHFKYLDREFVRPTDYGLIE